MATGLVFTVAATSLVTATRLVGFWNGLANQKRPGTEDSSVPSSSRVKDIKRKNEQ